MTSFLLVFNLSTGSVLRPVQLKADILRLTKNSEKVDLLKIDIAFIEFHNKWKSRGSSSKLLSPVRS